MNLRTKLPLMFACILVASMGAGLFSVYQLSRSVNAYSDMVNVDYRNAQRGTAALLEFKIQVQEWKNTLLRGYKPKSLNKYWNAFLTQEKKVRKISNELSAALPEGKSKQMVRDFIQAHTTMGEGYRRGFLAFEKSNHDSMIGDAAVKGVDRASTKTLQAAVDNIVADANARVIAVEAADTNTMRYSLIVMLTVLVISMIVAIRYSRSIVQPIEEARRVAERVAAGNIGMSIEVNSKGEIGQLQRALAEMDKNLVNVVGSVRSSADGIAVGSRQIAESSADINRRSAEQSTSLREAVTAMDGIATQIRQNADGSTDAAGLVNGVKLAAQKGGETMEAVVQSMDSITESSSKVADIVGVIDSIAFQTNILALNASVEAARAGDQGRGFAVVATEVRELAQRASSAASEIRGLIGESASQVESGSEHVVEAGTSINQVVEKVDQANQVIDAISQSIVEQSSGINQMSTTLSELERVMQQSSGFVDESAAAAGSLSEQSQELVNVVSHFKVHS